MNHVGDHFVYFQMGRWCLNDESWIVITAKIKGLSDKNELRIKKVARSITPSCKNTDPKACEKCRFLAWMYMVGGKPIRNYPRMMNLRKPKIGETLRCGICFGTFSHIKKIDGEIKRVDETVDEDWMKKEFDTPRFDQPLWVHQQNLYHVFEDCFLGYCGCEEDYH